MLTASKDIKVRFSEVDSMHIVWHGNYAIYFEDAREEFGRKYGIGYLDIYASGYYAPLVELNFKYKSPIIYGMPCRIDIKFVPTVAAKIIFEYEIVNIENNEILATGRSVQVFMDKEYKLVWNNPEFYSEWKKKWKIDL